MKDVKDYTTEELERLTTLTPVTARVGEYVLGAGVVQLRTKDRVVCSDGSSDTPRAYHWVERRVHSFANHTELDPPQAEMLAELGRRKQPVFQVGDVVVDVSAFQRGTLVVTRCPDMSAEWYSCVDGYGHKWAKEPKELRPATDAEIAAYHKAHCVSKAQPEVVSNATHAGRRVRYDGVEHIVASQWVAFKLFPVRGTKSIILISLENGSASDALVAWVTLL